MRPNLPRDIDAVRIDTRAILAVATAVCYGVLIGVQHFRSEEHGEKIDRVTDQAEHARRKVEVAHDLIEMHRDDLDEIIADLIDKLADDGKDDGTADGEPDGTGVGEVPWDPNGDEEAEE